MDTIPDRRGHTRSSIYHHIYSASGFCSKQTLAQELGLSLPTVYQNLSDLMDAGLVGYSGELRSTGGRRARGLAILPDARVAVGVSVTENRLRLTAADLRLQEFAYQETPLDVFTTFAEVGGLLAGELERFLDGNQIERSRLLGVGIALPAVISPDSRRVTAAPTLHLKDRSLDGLTQGIPYPVHVENDATSGGHAEWFQQKGHSMAFLSLENGVGGAVLLDGTPYPGESRRSGEFGHMCIEPGGLRCSCGKRGCLEAYCSPRRILEETGKPLEEFFAGVARQETEYVFLWENMLRHLALGIQNIRMVLDCRVVLGGLLTEYLPPYLKQLKEYVAAGDIFEQNADFLRLSTLRRHAAPLGAALHFIRAFLDGI